MGPSFDMKLNSTGSSECKVYESIIESHRNGFSNCIAHSEMGLKIATHSFLFPRFRHHVTGENNWPVGRVFVESSSIIQIVGVAIKINEH
jgi:hypothetical protein